MSMSARLTKDGVPVIDAKHDLLVFVTNKDVKFATPKDPHRCAIARAVRRAAAGGADAEVWRSIAYVKAPDSQGRVVWTRYYIEPNTRKRVMKFDRTGNAEIGAYTFNAPSRTRRVEYKAKHQASLRREIKKNGVAVQASGAKRKKRKVRSIKLKHDGVRCGSGHKLERASA